MLAHVIDRVGQAGRGGGEPRRAVAVSTLHSPRHVYTPVVAWFWELVIGLCQFCLGRVALWDVWNFPTACKGLASVAPLPIGLIGGGCPLVLYPRHDLPISKTMS